MVDAAEQHEAGTKITAWKAYTRIDDRFSYRVEYPNDWSVKEAGRSTFFTPSGSNEEGIAIVVINDKQTPPLPVLYTYTTIRTLRVNDATILIRKRQPSPVTERYFAEIRKGDYTAQFSSSLESRYDPVFDHMLSSYRLTVK